MPTFTGTSNDDVLTGTPGDDTIDAGIGRDTLTGGAGNDSLNSGPGSDLVMGDEGADTVVDNQGDNTIHGGAGEDSLVGVGLFYAEDGNDTVRGTGVGLTVVGGEGNDFIDASGELYGANGDDTIVGGGGSIVGGEAGNDSLSGGDGTYLVGGDGDDRIAGFYGSTAIGGDGRDIITNRDGGSVNAGAGDDQVTLTGGYSRLPIPLGPVNVDLGDGNDTAYLNSLAGGVIRGGNGDDTYDYSPISFQFPAPFTVVMDAGRDTLIIRADAPFLYTASFTVQGFSAGAGGDVLSLPALTSDPFATGALRVIQSGADVLVQRSIGGGFDNFLTFATLKDVTRSALTADNFAGWDPRGSPPIDTPFVLQVQSNWDGNTNPFLTGHLALVQEGADTVLLMDRNGGANEMITLARYFDTAPSAITAAMLGGVDPILRAPGLATNDAINPVDTGYPLHLYGGAGDDTITGLGRADTIDGGDGANTVQAGGGDDVIWVHAAPDRPQLIMAGEGADTLHFSSGAQVQLAGGADTAVIEADFVVGAPVELGFWDFQGGAAGDKLDLRPFLAAQTFWTEAAGNPFAAGYLRLVQTDVATFLQFDADGGGDSYRQLLYFSGTQASSLTEDNFFGFDPLTATRAGTPGDDLLIGRSGADTLLGGAGQDSITGGGGDDSLSGDAGSDTLVGGAGADSFRLTGESGMDWVQDFNAAEGDRVVVSGQAWTAYQYNSDVVVDVPGGRMMVLNTRLINLPLDWIHSVDNPASARFGTTADEQIVGGAGTDTLFGGAGADTISGGAGNDSLSGDAGSDDLFGGAGADVFRLTSQSEMDWVHDFNAAEGDRVMVAVGHTWVAYQFGSYTVVDTDGGRMMLENTQLSSLPSGWIFSG